MKILSMVGEGKITAEEAARLLDAVGAGAEEPKVDVPIAIKVCPVRCHRADGQGAAGPAAKRRELVELHRRGVARRQVPCAATSLSLYQARKEYGCAGSEGCVVHGGTRIRESTRIVTK